MKEKTCCAITTPVTPDAGKSKSRMSKHITHGFHLVKGKSNHAMEDYLVSEFKKIENNELGLFAIFDGHMGHDVANYLQLHLFENILKEKGVAKQLSVDHEPSKEKKTIESKGGFVSNIPGDVPRVDGQLAVARAFGDKTLKRHLSSEPDVVMELIDDDTEFIILASDGLWKVMSNQDAVDSIKNIKDARSAAKHLTEEALSKKSRDDISCIVVKFQ
ncbi:putative protein phosphatase 2C 39 [Camellia lanceoleosa]|uniref:Uncharacterized protein n=1 Tax=Camellia lanceoleosa TaxID=1840588 RepID=A0ACC0HDU3_9ERIC|nr:putative protein phosphatase 2C 39 [Camellia lanceoleosa]